jgi:hypothetical protein
MIGEGTVSLTVAVRLRTPRTVQYKFMAKLKPAGSTKKTPAKSARAAIPCLILVLLGIAAMCLLFYLSLQSGTS